MRPVERASKENGQADKNRTGLFARQYAATFIGLHSGLLDTGTAEWSGVS